LRELWSVRELIGTLAERDFRARYKQAALGAAWALLTPFVLMVVFTVFLRQVSTTDTQGAPYALFAYVGLLPWTFFSTAINQGGTSLLTNKALLNKVYCPREVFPLAGLTVAAVDTVIATSALVVLFIIYGEVPASTTVWLPILLLVLLVFTAAATLAISAVVVHLRDIRNALPLVLQLGLFATPLVYSLDDVPAAWRVPYVALNPLAAVVEGLRDTVLFGSSPDVELLAVAGASSAAMLVGAYALFKRLETSIADVA
jgi:ABC-type polysaccharide/polyol phosphate export permease